MILLGFKDLNQRQLFEILHGTKIRIEEKLEKEFKNGKLNIKTKSEKKVNSIVLELTELSKNIFSRSVYIFTICKLIQMKKYFSFETLVQLSDALNNSNQVPLSK